jgi:D-alanyl-D-alanine carboxypeptidase/D-alanyl-D-alanine-endopeptidase (penicillin-binding protein 4)
VRPQDRSLTFAARFLQMCVAIALAHGAELPSKLDAIISAAEPAHAFVGVQVVSLKNGEVLYQHNQDRLFIPASNMKLFTSALALSRLGAQYRLRTTIGANQPIDSKGTLEGDLIFTGGGDPSLSGREYPYRYHSTPREYSLRVLEEMADQVVARGLRRVDGDIIGDDSRYVWEPFVEDWTLGDPIWDYGAPVSALILDDNSFAITLRPAARAGDPAEVLIQPSLEYFTIDNRVRTAEGGERKIDWERKAGSRELHVRGVIPKADAGLTRVLAVDDPALYAALALRDALLRRGVSIRGRAVARHLFSGDDRGHGAAVILAERSSPPLADLLQVVDKVSQNLHAEVLLREVAAAAKPPGTLAAGLAAMTDFLTGIGISATDYRFADGSGLSRSTLVAPAAITTVLAYMYQSADRDEWLGLLPVAGVDGTLASRLPDHPEARAIRAKTGTLDHVRALSGYADSPRYGPLAFSFLVNNFSAPPAEIDHFLDQIALALLN